MIYYDSHNWLKTLFTIRGSVLPKAFLYSIPSAALAIVLKYLERQELISLLDFHELSSSSVYQGFTFVLGFTLVFRTSQAYQRYWVAATSIQEMGSEWSDACGSLIAFAKVSDKPEAEIHYFMHTIVRLFCLLHALALEELASLEDENFPVLDVGGFSQADLSVLLRPDVQGKKTKIVLCWIKAYIVQSLHGGLLKVPPPILTRVFQELGLGLVNFHQAEQVCIWPFPFPYTQLNIMLMWIYMCMTPLVIATWETMPSICGCVTLLSVLCMLGLSLIASELENPLGEDVNDLPAFEMQHQQNRDLLLLLNPQMWTVPALLPTHLTFADLVGEEDENRLSLQQYQEQKLKGNSDMLKKRGKGKLLTQKTWAGHNNGSNHGILGPLSKIIGQSSMKSMDEECQRELVMNPAGRTPAPDVDLGDAGEKDLGGRVAATLRDFTGGLVNDLKRHLDQSQAVLQRHLDQHLEQQGNLHKGQLAALEKLAETSPEGGNSKPRYQHRRQNFTSSFMSSSPLGPCGAPNRSPPGSESGPSLVLS